MPHPLDLLCIGEPLFEFSHVGDGNWREGFGGDVSNVAIAAARQGAKTALLSRLGADSFGDRFRALWSREDVDHTYVETDPAAPTGLYFITQKDGDHVFDYRRAGSAASKLSDKNLPRDALAQARIVHQSGISQAISPSARDAGFAAIEAVKDAGRLVSYDPNLRLKLWPLDQAGEVIHAAMARADIALPGLDDAQTLTGLSDPKDIVAFYRDLGPDIVALTMGRDGALVSYSDQLIRIPAMPAKAVDATGAGDCFDGSFLARLALGDEVDAAARYAVAAASLSVKGYGAVAPLPTGDEVCAVLDEQDVS
ncbi:sugar kinase [Aliiroseovarius sp. YM-037]|uniref:sugar kinase n=1 Tax=Aliiroseovarius sp. YM-037 TaxID=3341728 RepID=UPI003A7FDE83